MRFCFLGSELDTHFSSLELVLKELQLRGHEIVIKRWTFANQKNDIDTLVSNVEADAYLAEKTVPETEIGKNRLWIQLSHGVSAYKPWKSGYSIGRWKSRIVPTQLWADYGYENTKAMPMNPTFEIADGWCKCDLYYRAMQNRNTVRAKVFKSHGFDPLKPLVVYAPTGVRPGVETKDQWLKAYGKISGYAKHGSYYHKDTVAAIVSKYANHYEIPHPCVQRNDSAGARIDMIVASDLMISDISSMSLEYTVMQKPIILLQKNIEDRDPRDFHLFQEQDGPIVDVGDLVDIRELDSVLPYRLAHDDYVNIRESWRKRLLGDFDGKAAIREADIVERIAVNG